MKYLLIILLLFLAGLEADATGIIDSRKDSFDVIKYTIHLDVRDFKYKQLSGYTTVEFVVLQKNLSSIRLDLYKLNVDSIMQGGQKLAFSYNDSLLHIDFPPLSLNTDTALQVYYHGRPKDDPLGFGGFVFDNTDSGYAYNLGVSLSLKPHTFGRGWFPCVDNFTDKALFEFHIITKHSHKAFCNGLLLDSMLNADGSRSWHWKMNQRILPYLASVASASYATIYRTYISPIHNIPLICAVPHYDSAYFPGAFRDFNTAMAGFENAYGLYRFDRAGYFGMPFQGGAMEHATNIALPGICYTNRGYNTIWAHELSHHWWGDLMTCSSAEDMWLNEGWAAFSESIFEENVYGEQAYRNYALNNHYNALRYAYHTDNGYRAISPMPQDYTYGPTIYQKGADAVHSLRGYLGDSMFFAACHIFLDSFAWRSASTDDFRRVWIKSTGKDSLISAFISSWILNPGYPHYVVNKISNFDSGGSYYLRIEIGYLSHHSPINSALQIPLEILYYDSMWNRFSFSILFQGTHANILQKLVAKPAFIALDMDEKIMDATTKQYQLIKNKTTYTFPQCLMNISVNAINDSAIVYIEHHWDGPDRGGLAPDIAISTERFWNVDGLWPSGFDATATVSYDGSTPVNYNLGGYLDSALLSTLPEDSLRLLYRPGPGENWHEYATYKKVMGLKSDKKGTIQIYHLKKGQYTFATSGIFLGLNEKKSLAGEGISIFPNPATDFITIRLKETHLSGIALLTLQGKQIKGWKGNNLTQMNLETKGIAPGSYLLKISDEKGFHIKPLMVIREK